MKVVSFDVGESRYVRLLIKSINNEDFLIRSGEYELFKNGVVESSGACLIDGDVVMALITPSAITTYKLKISYHIGDETFVEVIEVVVR